MDLRDVAMTEPPLAGEGSAQIRFCTTCGHRLAEPVQYCTQCGAEQHDDSLSAREPSYTGGQIAAADPNADVPPATGWYPDPAGSGQLRYWNGQAWTAHLMDAALDTADAAPSSAGSAEAPSTSTANIPDSGEPAPRPRSSRPRRLWIALGVVGVVALIGVVLGISLSHRSGPSDRLRDPIAVTPVLDSADVAAAGQCPEPGMVPTWPTANNTGGLCYRLGPALLRVNRVHAASWSHGQLNLALLPADSVKFASITRTYQGKELALVVRGRVLFVASVHSVITDGRVEISGGWTDSQLRAINRALFR